MIVRGTEPRPAESVPPPERSTVTCPRCTGKGYIVCPECKGTGEERNVFWVVVGTCRTCVPSRRGFVTCPKCRGAGAVDPDTLLA
jgi:DnaJ-class molecular chaperone